MKYLKGIESDDGKWDFFMFSEFFWCFGLKEFGENRNPVRTMKDVLYN